MSRDNDIKVYLKRFEVAEYLDCPGIMEEYAGVLDYLNYEKMPWIRYRVNWIKHDYNAAYNQLVKCAEQKLIDEDTLIREFAGYYCYIGDAYHFFKCVYTLREKLGIWLYSYYYCILIQKISCQDYQEQFLRAKDEHIVFDGDVLNYIDDSITRADLKNECLKMISYMFVEAVVLKRRLLVSRGINGSTYIPDEDKEKIWRFFSILEVIPVKEKRIKEIFEQCKDAVRITKENIGNNFIAISCDILRQLLIEVNPMKEDPLCLIGYLEALMDIYGYEVFDNEIRRNLDWLLLNVSKYPQIHMLLFRAYILEMVRHTFNDSVLIEDEMKTYVESHFSELEIKENARWFFVYLSSTIKGDVALDAANWYYEQSVKNGYGSIDAGMIALSYFRILELEINERFIWPMIKTIDIDRVLRDYEQERRTNREISKRWRVILQAFQEMIHPERFEHPVGSLMLGNIVHLIKNIRKDCQAKTDKTMFNAAMQALSPSGKKAIITGEMEKYINKDVLNKYRNPPAHTKYLSYDIAREARDHALNALVCFAAWFLPYNQEN